MILHPQPISVINFGPYGTLIGRAGLRGTAVNEGRGLRLETGAQLTHTTLAKQPSLALYQITASYWPVEVRLMERHRQSAQMFLPLSGGSFLIVVAGTLPDGQPDIASAAAFTCQPGNGVIYAPSIWHLPLVALEQPAEFAMLMWENGTSDDCDEYNLASPMTVQPAEGACR